MKIIDPIDGKCPRCEVPMKHIPDQLYPNGAVDISAYDMCPSCYWHPGEWYADNRDAILACDGCGKVGTEFVKSRAGDDYCAACKRQEEIEDVVASIMIAAVAVNMQTDYCVFVSYSGHVSTVDVRVAAGKKEESDYNNLLASSTAHFGFDDGLDTAKRIHQCLAEIACTGKLPTLRQKDYFYANRTPLAEIDDRQVSAS